MQSENSKNVVSNSAFIISSGHSYLKRDRIQNLLEEAMQKPVVTVVAGAGYGKTQAVYAFLQEYDAKTIWQQLTALDNIGARFWENFVHVISLSNQKLALNLEMLGFPETNAKFDIFLSHISKARIFGKKYAFVYDDFHLIHDKKVLRYMDKLINTYIQDFTFILISRSEPEINTAGLLGKGFLSVISEGDLRFSKSELVCYYELQNIRISQRFIAKIYTDTDGWIMAIRLVELFIKKGVSHEEYALTAMKQNIYKLMESDVFSVVPKRVQKFLLKLSLFDTLPLELVELLSLNNKHLIFEASKINSFIRYDSFSNMYCIHHLFLDFLRQKQTALTHKEKAECYRMAAEWYTANSYRIDAITYYEKIGDYEAILKIALIFPYASREEADLLLDILSRVPEALYEQEPLLAVLHVRAHAYINMEGAINELKTLIKKYEALPQTQKNDSMLCEMYILLGLFSCFVCSITNDFSFPDYFNRSYRYISERKANIKVLFNIQEVGTYVCRISSKDKGDMEEYIAALNIAADYASKVMPGCMCGLNDLAQAELDYFKHRIKDSEKFARQALFKAHENGQYVIEIRALFILLRNALATGNYVEIQELVKQLDSWLKTEKLPNVQALYDIITGWFYSAIGQGGMVANWIKSNFDHGDLGIVASGVENLVKIKYCLSEKKHDDFLAFWISHKNEYSINSINAFLFGKIAMMASKAICLYHTNEKSEAIIALQEAYFLSEPNSLIMQFVELGNDMMALAKFALKSEDCAIPDDWLKNIIRKSSTYAKRLSYVASEYERVSSPESGFPSKLTKKELELLNDICHGMSTAEIAVEHGLSQNYLNNRMQTIYSKLGAANKIDAIRIATVMKLLK